MGVHREEGRAMGDKSAFSSVVSTADPSHGNLPPSSLGTGSPGSVTSDASRSPLHTHMIYFPCTAPPFTLSTKTNSLGLTNQTSRAKLIPVIEIHPYNQAFREIYLRVPSVLQSPHV
jgi:hypothetical protein